MRAHRISFPELGLTAAVGGLIGFGAAWLVLHLRHAQRPVQTTEPTRTRADFVATMAD